MEGIRELVHKVFLGCMASRTDTGDLNGDFYGLAWWRFGHFQHAKQSPPVQMVGTNSQSGTKTVQAAFDLRVQLNGYLDFRDFTRWPTSAAVFFGGRILHNRKTVSSPAFNLETCERQWQIGNVTLLNFLIVKMQRRVFWYLNHEDRSTSPGEGGQIKTAAKIHPPPSYSP